jgi:site-specific DNA recombinase
MKPAAIYIRVSDEKQTRGASLHDQEAACKAFAGREGLRVTVVYRDDGKSAWKDDVRHRPQFERLLAAAKSPKQLFSAVIVFKLDRFARKARIYHTSRYELERAGVQLLSASEPNEPTAAGRLSSGMLAEFAEFYSAQLSERIKASAQGRAARGEWVGGAPFGYELLDRRLVPGRLWLWVVAIFVAYKQGHTTVKIAQALNAARIPMRSGKPWTKDTVLMVLHARAYIGEGGGRALEAYQANHKPLISSELWAEVQAALSARRKRPSGPRKTPRPAPLPWAVRCALCNGAMHRNSSAGGAYLRCRGSQNKTCSARGVSLALVRRQVELLEQGGTLIAEVWLRAPRGISNFVVKKGLGGLPDA